MNESGALITSMNLYEYSESHNNEMGILVSSRYPDNDVYKEISEESRKLAVMSGIIQEASGPDKMGELLDGVSGLFRRLTAQPSAPEESSPSPETLVENTREESLTPPAPVASSTRTKKGATSVVQAPTKGFCIRCKVDLPVNPTRPYCAPHFRSWNRYKNEEYEESHCHTCGNEHTTSMLKPLCATCYRKYKDVLEFAAS